MNLGMNLPFYMWLGIYKCIYVILSIDMGGPGTPGHPKNIFQY